MPNYFTIPQDVLFFRDARPMTANTGSGGHGARWPEPSIIFDALHAALHRAFPVPDEMTRDAATFQSFIKEQQWDWQHPHRYITRPKATGTRNRQPDEKFRNQRFGALTTTGPFPAVRQNGNNFPTLWLFPAPADYVPHETVARPYLSPLRDGGGQTNLPAPFLHPLANPCEPSKAEAPPWWSKAAIEAALKNQFPSQSDLWQKSELYAEEWTTGIGIDPASQTQDGEHIYSAQYLRLRDEIAIGFNASLPTGAPDAPEGFKNLFPANELIICGGQQRACRVAPLPSGVQLKDLLPVGQVDKLQACSDGKWRIKWLLLSPAVFPFVSETSPGGWLPNWIAARNGEDHGRPFQAGDVLLKPEIPPKQPGESREVWRKRVARELPPISARLVAARVPKPNVVTGWTERLQILAHAANCEAEQTQEYAPDKGARPTLLAVPAGAVYYFETDHEQDARTLANALNWHGVPAARDFGQAIQNRRSTLMGEKGFGLGVCGTWDFLENGH